MRQVHIRLVFCTVMMMVMKGRVRSVDDGGIFLAHGVYCFWVFPLVYSKGFALNRLIVKLKSARLEQFGMMDYLCVNIPILLAVAAYSENALPPFAHG